MKQHDLSTGFITPPALVPGDKIAIISPASAVKPEYVDGAAAIISSHGFTPFVMPFAKGNPHGSYASSEASRVADLSHALHEDSIKAILCARGGYGCVQLLPHFNMSEIASNPKWLIGYSDVSALHALWFKSGVKSIHGPMAKHLTVEMANDSATTDLFALLENSGLERRSIHVPMHRLNFMGTGSGVLAGGNLAVLDGLAGTPYDILSEALDGDIILFLEDISEPVYKVERMLTRLYLSGVLHKVKGLVFGQFTGYDPDRNFKSMEHMIAARLWMWGINHIPVAFNFPIGHVSDNRPVVEGQYVTLTSSYEGSTLSDSYPGEVADGHEFNSFGATIPGVSGNMNMDRL